MGPHVAVQVSWMTLIEWRNQNHIKIPPHSSQNGYHQKHKQQQMLVRMQGKKNPYTMLVGMQTNTSTMESSMEIPQKTKNRTAI
jgi:hypothetical protein